MFNINAMGTITLVDIMLKNKILKDKVKPSHKTFCYISLIVAFNTLTGCSTFGPLSLEQTRLQYNETVKATTEQQLLLNIVRLRYTDTPSSLAVSAIAAQFERSQSFALLPFFVSWILFLLFLLLDENNH